MLRETWQTPLLAICLSCLFLAAVEAAPPRRYALIVGVKEYPASEQLTKLPFAETDATDLSAALEKAGYQTILMTQANSQGEGRQRFNPTEKMIRREFERLAETPALSKNDCVVALLSGHGIQLASKTDPERITYYYCPADAEIDGLRHSEDVQPQHNLIIVDSLYETLKACKAGVRLLVVDACRNDPNKTDSFRSGNSVTRPPLPTPPGGIAALFSCSANQKAVEDADLKHGVFSHYLLEALAGQGDTDGNGELTITELYDHAAIKTYDFVNQKYGRQQTPELSGTIQGWATLASVPGSKPKTMPMPEPMPTPVPVKTTTIPDPPWDNPTRPKPKPKTLAGSQPGELWDQNGLTMKFAWCPAGAFKMGSSIYEKERKPNETQVRVTLTNGFWLGQREVTQAEWEQLMGSTPWRGQSYVKEGDAYPVTFVSWEEATDFCRKLTAQERGAKRLPLDWEYRLPTEAQWEYACRAGTETRYAFPDATPLKQYAWYADNTFKVNKRSPQPVGALTPNAWNLHDLHGNVWEWCRDAYLEKLPGGENPESPTPSTLRTSRGGSFNAYGRDCRSAVRQTSAETVRQYSIGFRVALVKTR